MSTSNLIVFLDFDGVLHPEPCAEGNHFCNVPLFESAMDALPGAQIVISSSWAHTAKWSAVVAPFSPAIAVRIAGKTPRFGTFKPNPEFANYTREAECREWLRANDKPAERWIAIDDRAYLFRPLCENLVRCDPETGLNVSSLREISRAVLLLEIPLRTSPRVIRCF